MKTFVSMHFCDVWAYIAKVLYRICANRRPAAYKKIRFCGGGLLQFFPKIAPKCLKKGTFCQKSGGLLEF